MNRESLSDVLILSHCFLVQEKELEKWKCRVKDLESESFIKEQTIRQLQEQVEVRELFSVCLK